MKHALAALLLATAAQAEPPEAHAPPATTSPSEVVWTGHLGVSVLRIQPDPNDSEGYLVTFQNENVHVGDNDNLELTFPGGTVVLRLDWNVDPLGSEEIVVVSVPDGWGYWPERIRVRETQAGAIRLFPIDAGMM